MPIALNLTIFWEVPPAVQIHIVFAMSSLILGIVMFIGPKGTRMHKLVGRSFIFAMIMTATSAIFIRYINEGQFSWIHLFIPLTFYTAWRAVDHIRRGDVRRHVSAVRGLFLGALLIPGLFSFLPGRIMHMMVLG